MSPALSLLLILTCVVLILFGAVMVLYAWRFKVNAEEQAKVARDLLEAVQKASPQELIEPTFARKIGEHKSGPAASP